MTAIERVARLQAAYYVVGGAWPLVSMGTFEAITGPKRDRWLVRTVSLLLILTGGVLGSAVRRGRVTPEVRALGAGTAASLASIDLAYGIPGRISRIYVADALVELALIGVWWRTGRRDAPTDRPQPGLQEPAPARRRQVAASRVG